MFCQFSSEAHRYVLPAPDTPAEPLEPRLFQGKRHGGDSYKYENAVISGRETETVPRTILDRPQSLHSQPSICSRMAIIDLIEKLYLFFAFGCRRCFCVHLKIHDDVREDYFGYSAQR
jgi:hypothetical protein